MGPSHRLKRGDSKRKSQPPVDTLTSKAQSKYQSGPNSVSPAERITSAKESSHSMPPQAQMNNQPLNPAPGPQESRPTTRSIEITGPTMADQGVTEASGHLSAQHEDARSSQLDAFKELELARQQIDELNSRIGRMQQEMFQQVASTPNHHERMIMAENKVKSLSRSLRESQEKAALAEAEAQTYMLENHRLKHEAAETIQSLTKDHSRQMAADEANIRQLVDKVTRDKVEGRWNPPPDDEIRHRLTLLNNDMRDWAKDWASKDLNLDKGVSKETIRYLRDFVRLEIDGSLPLLIRKPPPKIEKRIVPLLLHAALAHEVHYAFFESPFFCTTIEQGAVLEDVFVSMAKADRKGAHIWRAGLWRILHPPAPEGASRLPPILEGTRERIKMYCETVGQNFRNGPAAVLCTAFPENSAELQVRATRLRTILLQASAVASSLLTQHSSFDALDLRKMQKGGMTFDVTSRLMQGHPLSKVDLDDEKFNGLGVVVVTRPALIAFDVDDAKGLEGDGYRVLAGAVMFLDRKY